MNISKNKMVDKSRINAKELGEFLLEAKRNTYASGSNKYGMLVGRSGKVYNFEDDKYRYEDTYFATDSVPFIGQEIVYRKTSSHSIQSFTPIWGMNYYGRLTEEGRKYNQKKLINFLRESLEANENIKKPFRGPMSDLSSKFDLAYTNKSKGNILDFKGKETIHVFCEALDEPGSLLYNLEYHGGLI
jgi:hypothetical protein